jgi:ABC-type phosphate/phosphonate transport system permease subunit
LQNVKHIIKSFLQLFSLHFVKICYLEKRKDKYSYMLMSVIGYALAGYLASAFVSVAFGVIMNRSNNEK